MGGINHKLKKYGSISPGPGAYIPKDDGKIPNLSFSMGSKLGSAMVDKNAGKTPGPGGYEPKMNTFKYDGHTKFGTGDRPSIYDVKRAKFVPGPNVYKQDASAVQRSAAKFSFGSEK
jgi:hypothetical protein